MDIRVADITSILSKVKTWLFRDQLEKPKEMILHRPIQFGGLGLHKLKKKALASLLPTLLITRVCTILCSTDNMCWMITPS